MHLSSTEKLLFYVLIGAAVVAMAVQVGQRARLWLKGKPIDWKPRYALGVWRYVLGQRKVQSSRYRSGAPMHMLLFYGFLALFVATSLLAIASYGPVMFHRGTYYLAYELTFDLLGLLFVAGVIWAWVRRAFFRPKSTSHAWHDHAVLALLFVLGVSGYWLEAARIANAPQPWDRFSVVGYAIAPSLGTVSNDEYRFVWWFHAAFVILFIAVLPRLRIRHLVTAIFSAAGHPEDQPMGELRPVRLEEVEESGRIGVALAKDYSRWHLLSLDACMECGRCTEACPAWNVGKVLNPKQIVLDVRAANEADRNVAEACSEEALWACTTCNACVEACPVLIRHVDLIVDARRNLVAEGQLKGSAAVMLRQLGSAANAWGAPASAREDWMKGLDVPLARDKKEFEVLLWVGCAGATDPGAMKTSRALVELFRKAGVDFACLGSEERCTGDPARRVGDEFLYQEMAQANIATLGRYRFERIVTPCPHCFNTFKNEYRQFGGSYRVAHHSQFLADLVGEGRLRHASLVPGRVTYHDPCYLARVNRESDAPRALLGEPGGYNNDDNELIRWLESDRPPRKLAEPVQFAHKTLCCGAGGGRMWMDEPPEQRPASRRVRQLLETGATTIALACPFCRIMLEAGVRQETGDESVRLVDVAEMLREANS